MSGPDCLQRNRPLVVKAWKVWASFEGSLGEVPMACRFEGTGMGTQLLVLNWTEKHSNIDLMHSFIWMLHSAGSAKVDSYS